MKHLPALRLVALTGLASLFAAPALAQDSYFYGGLSIGATRGRLDPNDLTFKQLPAGTTASGETRIDDHETNFKVFGGYQANRYLGFEAGYFTLGKFPIQANTITAGLPGTLDGRQNFKGLNFDVVGTLPFTDRFSGLGRIGAQFVRNRSLYTGSNFTPNDPTPNSRSTNYKVGVGLQYEITRSMLIRTELERYRVEETPGNLGIVNNLSIGLVFPLGREPRVVRSAAMAPYSSPAPAPAPLMAQAPPPAPAPAPAPMVIMQAPPTPPAAAVMAAVPERRRVSYSAESMFGFDQSAVRPAGMAALDTFTGELSGTQYEFITVEGHTDRLGSTEYNQKLSVERAEAVKAYLVSPGGVDAAKIRAVGMSESVPVTKPEDCVGVRATTQLKACLQPDRRVEIEVAGTKR